MQGGLDPPLAEGALGLALSPLQDAQVAEPVETWHGKAGLLQLPRQVGQWSSSSVATLSTHCRGLGGPGDVKLLSFTCAAAASVTLEKEERPWSWLAWGGMEEMPRSLKKETLPAAQGEVHTHTPPLQHTSATESAAPGCPICLKLAGLGIILQRFWARAQRALWNNSPSMAPAPGAPSTLQTLQTARLESRQKMDRCDCPERW